MELASWNKLSGQGPDLVLCLDFAGGRVAAGFAELAAGVAVDATFLHIGRVSGGPLAACVGRWVAEVAAAGRPVRAVLGFCAGATLATRVADEIAAAAPPPKVVLFDAVTTTAAFIAERFELALESSARHLTADELANARDLAEGALATYPDDLPRLAAALTGRYDLLMRAIAGRLSLPDPLRQDLTSGFTAYMNYLTLASEGGLDMRTATPLFILAPGFEPPTEDARAIALDTIHEELLRDPQVHKLVTELMTGEQPW